MSSLEVRDLLEQAASFERAGDLTEATARARLAVIRAKDPEAHDAATSALARLESAERRWRDEVARRQRAFEAREAREAGLRADPPPASKEPRPRFSQRRRSLLRAIAAPVALAASLLLAENAAAEPSVAKSATATPITIDYAPATSGLRLYQESGSAPFLHFEGGPRFWWVERGYAPTFGLLCQGPCTTTMAPGMYRLALGKEAAAPVPVRELISIERPSRLHASYIDRTGERTAGLLVGVGGGVIGALMSIVAVRTADVCNIHGFCHPHTVFDEPLMVTGIGVAVGAIIGGGLLASQRDEAHLSVEPLKPRS